MSQSQIRSANAWEKADLGDEERKNKFLRLMGAAKVTQALLHSGTSHSHPVLQMGQPKNHCLFCFVCFL